MAQFIPKANHFQALKNKVCVLSGGSTGIGAATATILAQQGAKVVIGDINTKAGNELASHLKSTTSGEATFTSCDVTHYQDIYNLFKTAHSRYGRVDHAVSCAGIFERGTWFSPDLTIENVGKEPGPSTVIDVNVMGTANFARVAVPFMRDSMTEDEKSSHEKSLTFLSSVNAFRESPKLYMYQVSLFDSSPVFYLTYLDFQTRNSRPDAFYAQTNIRGTPHTCQLRLSRCDRYTNDDRHRGEVPRRRTFLATS